jgi:hypothetical protein
MRSWGSWGCEAGRLNRGVLATVERVGGEAAHPTGAANVSRIYGLHPFCKKKIECPPKVMFACIYSACLVSVLSALALM